MWRYPDSPMPISVDMLRKLDDDEPGTYIATSKLNGHRHIVEPFMHKTKNGLPSAINTALATEFNALPWPKGIVFDAELVGVRHKGLKQRLYLFDVLYINGEWCTLPYSQRLDALLMSWALVCDQRGIVGEGNIQLMTMTSNPGLVTMFEAEKQCLLSEGIVIRHKDQVNTGSTKEQASGPMFLKCKHSASPVERA